jgi:phytoene desaturase
MSPHAIVIGSGFGGMAAALRACAKGYRVTVLEKLDKPGGRAYVHELDGFRFDAGPTIITASQFFQELWDLFGEQFSQDATLQWLDPFYRVRFDDGTHFDYTNDLARMREQIVAIAPDDLPGYEAFMTEAAYCLRLGFEELGCVAFNTLGQFLSAVPALVRMKGWRTFHQMVASHMRHPKLRMVFSLQSLLIGGNPFSVTSIYSLINALERKWGVAWAQGGTGALIHAMHALLVRHGGELRCDSEVAQIEIEPRGAKGRPRATGVRLTNGQVLNADIVISNADTAWTYKHLVDPAYRRRWTDRKIARGKYSMSLFVWYFGLNRQYPEVPHHQMVLGPRYEGLLTDIFRRHKLSDDFSLYVHRPTATDTGMAPAGCDTYYALSPVPHLDSGTDWPAYAETYRKKVAQRLNDTILPGFEQHVVVSHLTHPKEFETRLLSYKGAAFGLEPVMTQSAWFRPHNQSEDIDALYMVGASTHPGAGVPGVLMSAKALDTVLPTAAQWASAQPGVPHRLAPTKVRHA